MKLKQLKQMNKPLFQIDLCDRKQFVRVYIYGGEVMSEGINQDMVGFW